MNIIMQNVKLSYIVAIKVIAQLLNNDNISYIIGGSCSLLLHGIDILPNDIDIVIDKHDYNRAFKLLCKYISYENKFKINEIKGELNSFPINNNDTTEINIDNVPVKVYKLLEEYGFYKKRIDESVKVAEKLKLIENKLTELQNNNL